MQSHIWNRTVQVFRDNPLWVKNTSNRKYHVLIIQRLPKSIMVNNRRVHNMRMEKKKKKAPISATLELLLWIISSKDGLMCVSFTANRKLAVPLFKYVLLSLNVILRLKNNRLLRLRVWGSAWIWMVPARVVNHNQIQTGGKKQKNKKKICPVNFDTRPQRNNL